MKSKTTYRADKVLTLKEAGIKLANGDKDMESELLDTLRGWPHYSNWKFTLRIKKGHLASEVLLGAVVSFLEGEGFELDESWPRLEQPDSANVVISTSASTTKNQSEHIKYLAELIKQWNPEQQRKLTAKTLEAYIRTLIDKGVKGIPFANHGINSLALKGEDEPIKAFQNMYTKANKLLKRNGRFKG